MGINETSFYVGVFPTLNPSYWWLKNKPTEIGSQISSLSISQYEASKIQKTPTKKVFFDLYPKMIQFQ